MVLSITCVEAPVSLQPCHTQISFGKAGSGISRAPSRAAGAGDIADGVLGCSRLQGAVLGHVCRQRAAPRAVASAQGAERRREQTTAHGTLTRKVGKCKTQWAVRTMFLHCSAQTSILSV